MISAETTEETEPTQHPADDPAVFTVLAAQVAGAHGVTGNVRLRLIGAQADVTAQSLQASKTVKIANDDEAKARLLTLASLRKMPGPKSGWIGHFKEVKSRTDAETLIGHSIYIQELQRAPLPAGEYYVDQLVGLTVKTDTGHALGTLTDVMNTPAHDVYVTDTEVMIPAVPEFVIQIDLDSREILVRDVPGLREGT
jgi:16S rRNA processing protein RimM